MARNPGRVGETSGDCSCRDSKSLLAATFAGLKTDFVVDLCRMNDENRHGCFDLKSVLNTKRVNSDLNSRARTLAACTHAADRSVCLHAFFKLMVCGGQMDTHFCQSPSVGHMVAHKTQD